MGRPYANEVRLLGATYDWANRENIDRLQGVIDAVRELPLLVVGSGGSLTACHLAARLHEEGSRLPARVVTPLEFTALPQLQLANVLLLSAAGRNPDILAAARHAIRCEYDVVAAICTRKKTPLSRTLARYRHTATLEFVGPSLKDGFLATNSLVLTSVLLARAYGAELPASLPSLATVNAKADQDLVHSLARPKVIALAHGWATPAAADMESRWAEIGFGAVSVTDSRNVAHGRHLGLSKHLQDTTVVNFSLSGNNKVAAGTAMQLKSVANLVELRSELSGVAGAIDLIGRVILLAGEVGRAVGIDPGRPKVPAFGRALFRTRLQLPPPASKGDEAHSIWIQRKVSPVVWRTATADVRNRWRESLSAWLRDATRRRIGGLVLDYDGTVCDSADRFGCPTTEVGQAVSRLVGDGLVVGIATGRGGSVIESLRRVVAESAWRGVIIGMYSGATRQRLDESQESDAQVSSSIELAHAVLKSATPIGDIVRFKKQPTQLAVHSLRPLPRGLLYRMVCETISAAGIANAVEIAASGHSVDVVVAGAGKYQVVKAVEDEVVRTYGDGLDVMRIGDQGQTGGNDATLLCHPLGLSVDRVSSVMTGCWNVAPLGKKGSDALLYYLSSLRRHKSAGFVWSPAGPGRVQTVSQGK